MKDFVKGALLLGGVLALILVARVALFVPLHSEATAVNDPAPIAAAERGCAVRQVKMPCFRQANPEGREMVPAPRQSESGGAETIAAQDMRCAVQLVKFPCLQHTDPRS